MREKIDRYGMRRMPHERHSKDDKTAKQGPSATSGTYRTADGDNMADGIGSTMHSRMPVTSNGSMETCCSLEWKQAQTCYPCFRARACPPCLLMLLALSSIAHWHCGRCSLSRSSTRATLPPLGLHHLYVFHIVIFLPSGNSGTSGLSALQLVRQLQ